MVFGLPLLPLAGAQRSPLAAPSTGSVVSALPSCEQHSSRSATPVSNVGHIFMIWTPPSQPLQERDQVCLLIRGEGLGRAGITIVVRLLLTGLHELWPPGKQVIAVDLNHLFQTSHDVV